ncbi:MAG: ankyrin repeat domain-containing protein [Gammaproteobacteria bacterium]|nr:ankyrin repeat domain-containing protein [Gammaproteobacteria bacterium]
MKVINAIIDYLLSSWVAEIDSTEKIKAIKQFFYDNPQHFNQDDFSNRFYSRVEETFYSPALFEWFKKSQGLVANEMSSKGQTLLCVCAEIGEEKVAEWLIKEQGANVNLSNFAGYTPLLTAVKFKQTNILHLLLDQENLEINVSLKAPIEDDQLGRLPTGTTALHVAVRTGHLRGVQWLTYKDALQTKDANGQTPLKLAYAILHLLKNKPDQMKESRYYTQHSEVPTIQQMEQVIKFLNYEHIPHKRKVQAPQNTLWFFQQKYIAGTAMATAAVTAAAVYTLSQTK